MYHTKPPSAHLSLPAFIRGVGFIRPDDLYEGRKARERRSRTLRKPAATATGDEGEHDGVVRANKPWYVGAGLRLAGLLLMGAAVFAIRTLVGIVDGAPQYSPGMLELILAAVGFVGASLGLILTLLGAHIFDRIPVAAAWRQDPRWKD